MKKYIILLFICALFVFGIKPLLQVNDIVGERYPDILTVFE